MYIKQMLNKKDEKYIQVKKYSRVRQKDLRSQVDIYMKWEGRVRDREA